MASGVATDEEAEECISSEFNPVRAGFRGSPDVWTRDVLNLGVRPDRIIAKVHPLPHPRHGLCHALTSPSAAPSPRCTLA